jgi:hypothetical protein
LHDERQQGQWLRPGRGGGVYYKSESSFIHVNTNVKANKATIKRNDIFKGT